MSSFGCQTTPGRLQSPNMKSSKSGNLAAICSVEITCLVKVFKLHILLRYIFFKYAEPIMILEVLCDFFTNAHPPVVLLDERDFLSTL